MQYLFLSLTLLFSISTPAREINCAEPISSRVAQLKSQLKNAGRLIHIPFPENIAFKKKVKDGEALVRVLEGAQSGDDSLRLLSMVQRERQELQGNISLDGIDADLLARFTKKMSDDGFLCTLSAWDLNMTTESSEIISRTVTVLTSSLPYIHEDDLKAALARDLCSKGGQDKILGCKSSP